MQGAADKGGQNPLKWLAHSHVWPGKRKSENVPMAPVSYEAKYKALKLALRGVYDSLPSLIKFFNFGFRMGLGLPTDPSDFSPTSQLP